MRHPSAGELRRLLDDPWAVAEPARRHVGSCVHCARRQRLAESDAAAVAALLPDLPETGTEADLAWARFRRSRESGPEPSPVTSRFRLRRRLTRRGVAVGVAGLVVIGATSAAAAEVVSVLSPTRVAPVQLAAGDLSSLLAALPSASLTQSDHGRAYPVETLAQAEADTGLHLSLPSQLPRGISATPSFRVQPAVSMQLSFGATSTGPTIGRADVPAWLAGTTLRIQAGPAVLVTYATGTQLSGVPGLVLGYSVAPVLTASGATAQSIEDYVLSRPGVSPALAAEIRVLGAPGAVLPVPIPAGASVRNTTVGGSPAVALSDPSGIAAGVIWEEGRTVRAVGGLVSTDQALTVANELG